MREVTAGPERLALHPTHPPEGGRASRVVM